MYKCKIHSLCSVTVKENALTLKQEKGTLYIAKD